MKEENEKEKPKKKPPPLSSLALLSQIGTTIIANLVVALLLGYFIDNFFGTMPIFFLIFAILGILSSMMSIYYTVKKYF